MNTNITSTLALLQNLVTGLKKAQPKGVFLLSGTKYTATQLATLLQSIVAALTAVGPAKAAYLESARTASALLKQNQSLVTDLKQYLQLQAGAKASMLTAYGLTPKKPKAKPSSRTKVVALDKSDATRAARHTMGKRQKAAITGASAAATNAQAEAPAVTTSQTPAANPAVNLAPSMPNAVALTSATTPVIPGH